MKQQTLTASAPDRSERRRLVAGITLVLAVAVLAFLVWDRRRRTDGGRLALFSSRADARRSARYVGDADCRRCHAAIARSYDGHPMGRSLAPIALSVWPGGGSGAASGKAEFQYRGLVYSAERSDGRVVHREMRRDQSGRTVAEIHADVQYSIGSGRQGVSYLIERDGFLLQSPITWYAKDERWGLSPGYEARTSRFDRPVAAECLFCHANRVERVSSAINRYRTPVFQGHAIGCERCHGPGEAHVRQPAMVDGHDPTIVNPAALEPSLRDAVCEQCHLIGRRIARLDAGFDDFRPGKPFYQFWSAFVPAGGAAQNKFAGQPEQMHDSACFRGSAGRLGCISCHDPHVLPSAGDKVAYYRERCLSCHESAGCSLQAPSRGERQPSDDCIGCHMPRGESSNNPHVATTNHRIPRFAGRAHPAATSEPSGPSTETALVNFHSSLMSDRERALAERDRGIALCRAGGKNAAILALPLLEAALAARPNDIAALEAKGETLARLGRPLDGLAAYRLALAKEPTRQTALEGAAYLAGKAGRYQQAIAYWKQAIAVNPWRSDYRGELALAQAANRDWRAAAAACREALAQNPFAMPVRRCLLQSYLRLGQRDAARTELEVILGFDPPDRDELLRRFEAVAGAR